MENNKKIDGINTSNTIEKEDLINQYNLLKKSSNEAYANQEYSALSKLTQAMIELYKIIVLF